MRFRFWDLKQKCPEAFTLRKKHLYDLGFRVWRSWFRVVFSAAIYAAAGAANSLADSSQPLHAHIHTQQKSEAKNYIQVF